MRNTNDIIYIATALNNGIIDSGAIYSSDQKTADGLIDEMFTDSDSLNKPVTMLSAFLVSIAFDYQRAVSVQEAVDLIKGQPFNYETDGALVRNALHSLEAAIPEFKYIPNRGFYLESAQSKAA